MLVALWIVTGILATVNLYAGAGKALTGWEKLSQQMPWTETTGKGPAYLAAWAEVVGAIGLIVPLILAHTVTGWEWAAWVSLAAAIGLTIIQVLAFGVHYVRKEHQNLPVNVVLFGVGVAAAILIIASQ